MRKLIVSIAAAAAVCSFAATVSAKTLILNSGYPDNNFHTKNIRAFAADVAKFTDGKLEIDVHSAQELFKLRETKQAIQTGQIPMGEIMMPGYGNESPLFMLSGVPFLAASYENSMKLYKAAKPHLDAYLDKQKLKLLFVVPWPAQAFYTKDAVSKAADFKGLKFRAYSPMTARLGEELGALPTTIEYSEIPQAFATGLVSSMYTSAQTGIDSQAWDFANYFTNVGGNHSLDGTLISKIAYGKLTAVERKAIDKAAAIAQERGWKMALQAEKDQVGILTNKGMKAPMPSAAFMAELDKIGETLTAEWLKSAGAMGQDIIKSFRAMK
jgi:TRAP-type transport system periplasmic protein